MQMFRALWAYRSFILTSVMREFHGRYRNTLFGALWSVAGPLSMIVIYTLVFSQLMSSSVPGYEKTPFAFSIYLCAGVITWGLLAEMLGRLNEVFTQNGNLIKKASFPRACLPAIAALSGLLNFGIIFGLYLAFLLIIDHFPGWPILAALPVLALQILFCLGLGVILGTLNVFFRDVGQLTQVVLQFWFWLTPIVYTPSILPEGVKHVLTFNPAYPLISAYQTIFLEQKWPDWSSLAGVTLLTAVLLILAARLFLSRVGELVDEL
jgi:lipopolysaccharide transport system permease protein